MNSKFKEKQNTTRIIQAVIRELPVRWSKVLNPHTLVKITQDLGFLNKEELPTIEGLAFLNEQLKTDYFIESDVRRYEIV